MTRFFRQMSELIPQGIIGCANVVHRTPSDNDMFYYRIRGMPISKQTHTCLFVNGGLMMSDGDNEHRTNVGIVHAAKGKVLIAGLGIGMILDKILQEDVVESVLVIEKYQDVIDLISPHVRHSKLTIICADIFDWKPERGQKFNTIYFDIWPDICTDNLPEIAKLHQRFKNYKATDGYMASWAHDILRYMKRRGR